MYNSVGFGLLIHQKEYDSGVFNIIRPITIQFLELKDTYLITIIKLCKAYYDKESNIIKYVSLLNLPVSYCKIN